ncbi:MAG TPA: hypothetical protein PKN04_04835 [bacterium]|nr:hypothetical protein [bacterium]HNT65087.1 hypothetical protein [bacterium]
MKQFRFIAIVMLLVLLLLLVLLTQKVNQPEMRPRQQKIEQDSLLFYRLCDHFVDLYPAWDRENYRASYAVRALAVAYEKTGNSKYFAPCLAWADSMVIKQSGMTVPGAYFMGYFRQPGEPSGQWFVADASCIAMGVLATAMRCKDENTRRTYLESVKSYAAQVLQNYVRESGGITDGIWDDSDEEWWCSTSLFASLAYLMFEQTGEQSYLDIGNEAVDWLFEFDYNTATTPSFDKQGAPTVIFYTLEALTAGWPHLQGERRERAQALLGVYVDWVIQNIDRNFSTYIGNWGAKIGGLPFHLLFFERATASQSPEKANAAGQLAREILDYLAVTPFDDFQRSTFTAFSLTEQLYPDAVYHRPVR